MIKTILWDFDGVILDSMKIKGDGFLELFKGYNQKYLDEIEEYHYKYGGVSRFDKIRYFYEKIIQVQISDNEVIDLADKFAIIIETKLADKNNLIQETVNFIKKNYRKYNFHIVSGAEHDELNKLCANFRLTKYFKTIEGSPTKKNILVERVLDRYGYKKNEVIFIGDAMTDYKAAKNNGIKFYGFNNVELLKCGNYIEKFKDIVF